MENDKANNGKTITQWNAEIGIAAMLLFDEIVKDSFIYEGKPRWIADKLSRQKIGKLVMNRNMKSGRGVSDIRAKQSISTLVKNGLLTRESRGKYIINERVANISILHPTKSGR